MDNPFIGRDVISILDFSRKDLEQLFRVSREMERFRKSRIDVLRDKIIALAFFEPSTRTRLSFETAAKRLGANVIGFSAAEATSVAKGENLADTIRMLDSYADLIVIRHRFEGAAKFAAEVASNPVINAGDGKQHHPTQAMLDLYTILKLFGRIDGLTYAVVGDLRYGRAATSFIYGLTLFEPRKIFLVSPPLLRARTEVLEHLRRRGVPFEEVDSVESIIEEIDVMYVTRIQRERFPDPMEYEKVRGAYRITLELLEKGKDSLKVLHPLPKVDEIDHRVDSSKYAAYFEQAANGVPVRMALLALILGADLESMGVRL
ncbi:MAG: aspartate carbamoyltransferase [Crenarchaeota archaeon]|nr:aspartate carbamoyltransferase [Thermoproteota archaeon]